MSKAGAHKPTASVELVLRNDKAESYIQYLDACGQLLTKYKKDIECVEKMRSQLRNERIHFFEVELVKVRKILEEEGIPKELAIEWLKEINNNFNDSFLASEQILKDFSYVSIGEMKNKLKEIIDG